MNVILGDDFEKVALHIALHSCREKKKNDRSGECTEKIFLADVKLRREEFEFC